MKISRSGSKRILVPTAWAALAIGAVSEYSFISPTLAQDPAPAAARTGSREPEKTVTFEMRDKPWSSVLEWLADQSGLPVSTLHHPTGTFTFIAPRSQSGRKYTISEVIDILNEALVNQKYILIRREQSFTIVPSDEKIDPAILPRLTVDDLNQRGKSELAQVVVPLKSLVAEDLAPEVKKMMGPFGEVVPMARANQLVLQDTVGNLRRVIGIVGDIENNDKSSSDQFSHVCIWIKARDAEKVLKEQLGDPLAAVRAAVQEQTRSNQGGGFPFPGGGGRGQPGQPIQLPKVRMHQITADERTNTILVTGPADKINQARQILRSIDVNQPGQPKTIVGPALIKTYAVPGGNADTLAKTLQNIYQSSSVTRITAVGSNSVMVYAMPEDQIEIAKHITSAREDSSAPELVTLNNLDATKAVTTLQGMFGADPKTGAPFLEADTGRNAVVIKGTVEQVRDVKEALKALGETAATGGPVIVNISQGSAAALAEELQRLLSNMRANPVKVNTPGGLERKLDKEPKSDDSSRPRGNSEEQEQPPSTGAQDPQAQAKPGNKSSPITITVVGNQLIITSDDPEALRVANSLVRLLSQSPKGEGDFEIIHLKNASATEAAKVLDEAFNGVKATAQQQQGGGFGPAAFFNRFAQQQQPPANPAAGRIRVVADVGSNSLLVRASPLDMLAIKRLLDKAIDSGDTDSKALIKRHMLPPLKAASASEVVQTLKEVFREQLNPSDQISVAGGGFGGPGGGFRGGRFSVNRNVDANGNPIATALTIGMDERTNRIWVSCSDALYEDVAKVVKDLDDAAKDAPRTVRFVTIRGLDPLVVQQAIDAIQGRRPAASTANNQGGFGGQGFGGFGGQGFRGFGGQGFGPGGQGFGPGGGQGFGPGGGGGQGFVPGGGGGGFRGGNQNGPGGGGARPGGGGQGMRPGGQQNRGPGFFDQGVMDDPRMFSFFDPQHVLDGGTAAETGNVSGVQQAGFEESQQPPSQTMDFTRPRLPVTVDALGQTDMVIINANSLEDAKLTEQIIIRMQELAREAEVEIKLIPLKKGDATGIATNLAAVYSRVGITASGNILRSGTTPGAQGGFFGNQQATGTSQLGSSSVVLQPVPRLNAIFVAAPRIRMKDVEADINRLDQDAPPQARLIPIPLKKAPAARVAVLVNNFWTGRYPNETAAQHQVRLTYDDSVNTIFVQAAPADFAEISELIERIENTVSSAVNELRIIHLNYALADEVTNLLNQAISSEIVAPTTMPATTSTTTPGAAAAPPGGTFGGAAPGAAAATATPTPTKATKTTSLRFISNQRDRRSVEAGILEDIHISPDERLNSLIIAAPAKSMDLILALVHELDAPPANRAEVKVFTLRNADASTLANTISQLYFASTTAGATGPGPTGGGGGGLGALGAVASQAAGTSGVPQAIFSVMGTTPEGAPLVALHMAVDQRTNSLIVAGGRNDLDVIEAVVTRLEDSGQARHNEVYQLHNAFAADVANSLQTYFTNSLQVLSTAGTGQYTSHEVIEHNVVVVPEPVSNRLLISASPDYLPEVMRVIMEIDAQPPQVVIQVLVAEVDFNSDNEFGVEIGLQSPVLFQRSIFPANGFLGTGGSINYANASGGLVPPGVTINSVINPAAQPGFLFNQTIPLGNNPVVSPGVVGFQGLSNLGVGRASPTSGIGGFVFSAGSDSFNILVRALQTQGRIDILSRPQLQTTDNQTATINIGQQIPYIGTSNVTATGVVSNTIDRTIVGVNLQVTPHISPDGTVMMRVTPQISSPVATQVSLGNGTTAVAFNVQQVDTTVTAEDGQTVVIGGLIVRNQQRNENKVPWLGDLPYIGTLFRYRTETKSRTELLVIMTPHIVRCRADADRVAGAEAARMDWIMGNVRSVHETTGMEPFIHARDGDCEHAPHLAPAPTILPPEMAPAPANQPAPETLPKPKPVAPVPAPKQAAGAPAPASVGQVSGVVTIPATDQPASDAAAPEPRKEKSGWSLWNAFRRN